MEGRRRLVLLALLIVAVAIGAVGITLVSLYSAGLEQVRRDVLVALATPGGHGVRGEIGSAAMTRNATDGTWQVPAAGMPDNVHRLAARSQPEPDVETWLQDPRDELLVAVRGASDGSARIAWATLDDLRAPFHRAALQAALGIAVLLIAGLLVFYRATAPLLRSVAESEARYRTLFASTADGVLVIGNGIEECNGRFCEMFGVRRGDVLGLPWREFFRRYTDGNDLSHLEAQVRAAVAGQSRPFTWQFHPATGNPLTAEILLRPLQVDGRAVTLASLRDVTERERTAAELRAAEEALRTSRERLAQAGRSSALVELAAGIAHELNQPLAAIANYAQACRRLVDRRGDDECARDVALSLERIDEQARRAGDAIHRIRALVAPAGSRLDRTCINSLVPEVVDLMREEVGRAGARVELDLEPAPLPVVADPVQIQQVVEHLLRNAVEAIAGVPAARRVVRITTRRDGDRMVVTVADQGPGISPEVRAHLFDPFCSTKEYGMGMGLAISMSIIQSLSGELDVVATEGQGACFRFRLPADPSATRSDATCRESGGP